MKRTGVFVCGCGPNIKDSMDIELLAREAGNMDGVVLSETFGLLCSPAGKKYLGEQILEHKLDRVVIAACSPREHEKTFMSVCEEAGLNPFMMEMANIREHVAWVTRDPDAATSKALKLIRGAVNRAAGQAPLQQDSITCNPEVAVIGGGISAMTLSLLLADADRRITILHRHSKLGGKAPEAHSDLARELAEKVSGRSEITVLHSTEPKEIVGFFGNFIIQPGDIRAGAVVLATGSTVDSHGSPRGARGIDSIASMLRVEVDDAGYPAREHQSLAPVNTPMEGVYVVGCAGGTCSTEAAVASAEAAAGGILSTLVPGRLVETEPRTSVISVTLCRGCGTCMAVCGFGAISLDPEQHVCEVNQVLCKGCGNCAAACPSGAVRSQHFTPDQLSSQVRGVLK